MKEFSSSKRWLGAGDWRHAVNFRVTEAERKLEKQAEALKRAAEEVAAIERAERVKVATPKTVLMPAKYHVARWRKLTGVRKSAMKKG